jgi:hypothetical protein
MLTEQKTNIGEFFMNRENRRKAEKAARRKSVVKNGAFGISKAEKNYNVVKEKRIKTFSRYLKEGKNEDLLKSRKSFISAIGK